MKLVNIGFNNFVAIPHIVSVVGWDSAPTKRLAQIAKEKGLLIDATYGRKTKSVIVTASSHVILSSLYPLYIQGRIHGKEPDGMENQEEKNEE